MLPHVLHSLIREIVFSVVVLSFSLSLILLNPANASAYSLKDLTQQVTAAQAVITDTATGIGHSAMESANSVGADMGNKVLQTGKAAMEEAVQVGTKVGSTGVKAGRAITRTASEASEAVGGAVLQAGRVVTDIAVDTTTVVGNKALDISKVAIETTEGASIATAKETALLVGQAANGMKSAAQTVASQIANAFEHYAQPLLETAIEQVDLTQIEATVKQIQQEVSDHKAETLAKRLIDRKVVQASVTDNWLETARLQAEMIYEIAAVHGFRPNDEKRRQEILDIAAANLGSSQLLGNSLPLVKFAVGSVPGGNIANLVIDAEGDHLIRMLMFPLLGRSACKHYAMLQVAKPESSNILSPELPID